MLITNQRCFMFVHMRFLLLNLMSYPINPRALKKTEEKLGKWLMKTLQAEISQSIDLEILIQLKNNHNELSNKSKTFKKNGNKNGNKNGCKYDGRAF